MASLTLQVGTISASVNVADATATPVLLAYADAIGAGGTNQEKANAVVQALAQHITETARRQKWKETQVNASAAAQPDIDALKWGNGV